MLPESPALPPPQETSRGQRRAPVREEGHLTMHFAETLDWLCNEMRASGGRGELTVSHYRAWTRRFFWFLQCKHLLICDLTSAHVKEWAGRYADKRHATRQSLAKALNAILPLLHEGGHIPTLPTPLKKLGARTIVEPYILSDDEVRRLSGALAPMRESETDRMDFVLLSSLLHTGLRAMELLTIKTAELRRGAVGEIIAAKVRRKWRMESYLPISSALDPIWREWLALREAIRQDDALRRRLKRSRAWADSPYLFPGNQGGHLTYGALYRIVKKIGQRIDLPGVRPHLFRHYFGTKLHESGAAVPEVMSLMGHRDMRSQAVYLHANLERQKAAVERFGKLVPNAAAVAAPTPVAVESDRMAASPDDDPLES